MNDNKSHLTAKEEEIMLLLWEHGPCSVKDLTDYFAKPKPHVNTVSTFVRILEKKGYVTHKAEKNGSYSYYAIKKKKEYGRKAIGQLVKKYFASPFSMVSQLVEDEEIDEEQLRELLDMIERRK